MRPTNTKLLNEIAAYGYRDLGSQALGRIPCYLLDKCGKLIEFD